jgi:hypothetical protein
VTKSSTELLVCLGHGPQENSLMTNYHGRLSREATYRAGAIANGVEANERRRQREPRVIDWHKAIASLHDMLDDDGDPHI